MRTDRPAHSPGQMLVLPTFLGRGQVGVAARQGSVSNVIKQQPLEGTRTCGYGATG